MKSLEDRSFGLKRIRILVADLPRILQEIVTNVLRSQEDMEIVGLNGGSEGLTSAVSRYAADVLIIPWEEEKLAAVGVELLLEHPALEILAVGPDGRRSFLYRLRPEKVPLGEVSPQLLVEAIRSAVQVGSSE